MRRALRPHALVGVALVVACSVASSAASADASPADRALAESLFTIARDLMKAGRYPEACPKLEESQRLDPGGGTLLNLGLCHEAIGRTASAWIELTEAARSARAENKPERERIARDHLAAVEPRVPRFAIIVAPEADVPGIEVAVDGAPLRRQAWGVAAPLDPGAHVVTATAPGHRRLEARLTLPSEGGTRSLTIGPLAPGEDVAAPGPAGRPASAPPSTDASTGATPSWLRIAGFGVGGVGVVSLGLGSFFGIRAISKRHDSDDQCPKERCTPAGFSLNEDAKHAALASDVLMGVGLAAIGAGVTMVIVARPSSPAATARTVFVAPSAGPTAAGLSVGGAF